MNDRSAKYLNLPMLIDRCQTEDPDDCGLGKRAAGGDDINLERASKPYG